jgi:hypothetical protein
MFGYFYNQNLRKLVVAFGSLFSNLEVGHVDPTTGNVKNIRVPIHYSPQEKFIQRLLQPSSITTGTRIELQVPIISFNVNSIVMDSGRRVGRFTRNDTLGDSCPTGSAIESQIPVNVSFNLFVYTRHTDDMLQIVEQIMPYFVPDHTITLDFNAVQQNVNIPIVLVNNNLSERYDGDFSSRRLNITSFQFLAKTWIFGKIQNATGITGASGGGEIVWN